LHEIGISGKREMLAVRVLEGAAGLLPQQALPRSGGSSGPTREVNFQQEAIDFSGPKRSLTCARILSGRASAFFATSDRGALLRHADCMA
jgi:hypothetical protein